MTRDEWNRAIVDLYFPVGSGSTPVYLSVSRADLQELGGDGALGELEAAVRTRYLTLNGDVQANAIRYDARGSGELAPPYLILLALCALAASEMRADPALGIQSTNYYHWLNPHFGRAPNSGAPRGFKEIDALWAALSKWLATPGRDRGRPTISTHPHFSHVGYPISQTLFPARDRNRLPDFFEAAGWEPGGDVSVAEMVYHFRGWAVPGRGLRPITVQRAKEPGFEGPLGEILEAEFRSWDGGLKDEKGRLRPELVLDVFPDPSGCDFELVARRPDAFPEELQAAGVHLEAGDGPWYQPLPLDDVAAVLAHGRVLLSDNPPAAFTFSPRLVLPLHQDPDLNVDGWISARRIRLNEPLNLLVVSSKEEAARKYLTAYGRLGPQPPVPGLPEGWVLIQNAVVSSTDLPACIDSALEVIAPRLSTSMALEGGLQVDDGVYLSGELPWVHLGTHEAGELVVDDSQRRSVRAGGDALALSDLELGPGTHTLRLGQATRRIRVVEGQPLRVHGDAGSMAYAFERHGQRLRLSSQEPVQVGREVTPGRVFLSGAQVRASEGIQPPARPEPLLIKRRQTCYLVGSQPGEILHCPPRPAWLQRIGPHAGFQFCELQAAPFACTFVLWRATDAWRAKQLPPGGEEGEAATGDVDEWAEVIRLARWDDAILPDEPGFAAWRLLCAFVSGGS